ncbi:SIMPL domain-containing protein [Patescibacteria group bacterium]
MLKKNATALYKKYKKEFLGLSPKTRYIIYVALVFLLFSSLKSLRRGEIEVIGTHSIYEQNTQATFIVSVTEEGTNKDLVAENVNKKGDELKVVLLETGLREKDLKTINNFIFERSLNQAVRFQETKIWEGGTSIEIKLSDINKVNELSSTLSGLSSIEVYGPTYTVDLDSIDEGALLVRATRDAKKKAVKLAASQGKRVVRVLSIEELSNSSTGVFGEVLGMGGDSGGSTGHLQGTTKITKSVRVRFVIR